MMRRAPQQAPPAILTTLRASTESMHARLESLVDLQRRLQSREAYAELLAKFLGFYRPLEDHLAALPADMTAPCQLHQRWKTALLVQDLRTCGRSQADIRNLPDCAQLPHLQDHASVLGCLYVLEGATLGGQVICREVRRAGILPETEGCAFFSSYGEQVRPRWKQFCEQLNEFATAHPQDQHTLTKSAVTTFACLGDWFSW